MHARRLLHAAVLHKSAAAAHRLRKEAQLSWLGRGGEEDVGDPDPTGLNTPGHYANQVRRAELARVAPPAKPAPAAPVSPEVEAEQRQAFLNARYGLEDADRDLVRMRAQQALGMIPAEELIAADQAYRARQQQLPQQHADFISRSRAAGLKGDPLMWPTPPRQPTAAPAPAPAPASAPGAAAAKPLPKPPAAPAAGGGAVAKNP